MQTAVLDLALIHVNDMAVERAFYTEKFGLEIMADGKEFVQFAQPGGAGASLALSHDGEIGDTSRRIELWWSVQDAEATRADLTARGVETSSPIVDMPFGRTFSITDPEGNVVYFLQAAAA